MTQTADGSPGGLTNATLLFSATDAGGSTTSYGPDAVSAGGLVTRTIPSGLSKGTYSVTVQIDPANGYFQAAPRNVNLVVSDPASPLWAVQYRSGAPSPGYSYALPSFFQFWQQVRIQNVGSLAVQNVVAYIDRVAGNTEIVDGQVSLGSIAAGSSAWSADTFTLRVNLSVPAYRCDSFSWRIEYNDANGPHVLTDIPQFRPGPAPGGCR